MDMEGQIISIKPYPDSLYKCNFLKPSLEQKRSFPVKVNQSDQRLARSFATDKKTYYFMHITSGCTLASRDFLIERKGNYRNIALNHTKT